MSRAERVIDLVSLRDVGRHRLRALSDGMRMRVSLAWTLASDPDLPLLDELTRHQLGVELTALFARRRRAALLVTHSVAEAVFLSTEVIAMSPRPDRRPSGSPSRSTTRARRRSGTTPKFTRVGAAL